MPILFGVLGAAVLMSLGFWQLQRLEQKLAIVARIEERMADRPVALPDDVSEVADKYRRVLVSGVIGSPELHVLTSIVGLGPGFEVIAPLQLADGRRILLDRGFIVETEKNLTREIGPVEVSGSLHWPQETDSYTPDPNLKRNIWFARDVEKMAAALGTEPVLVVVAESSLRDGPRPRPVTVNIPNRHLEYVITWFLLAVVWIGMTGYLLWRIKRRTV